MRNERHETGPAAPYLPVDGRARLSAIGRTGPATRSLLAALFAVGAAAIQMNAQAQVQPNDQDRAAGHGMHHGPRHGMGPGDGHGMGMMFGGSPDRMARGIDRMLGSVNASDAQRTQIKQIVLAAAADLKTQREAGADLRRQSMQLFTAPAVDADAAESLRRQLLAQHDQASKRMLQAMLDVAKVLTPEQRTRLGQQMQSRATMMMRHGHGGPQHPQAAAPAAPAAPQKP